MTFSMKIGIDAAQHDAFVGSSRFPQLLQTSAWGDVKSGWGHERIGFFDEDRLVASCLVLRRSLPLGFSFLYIPRGILMDYEDSDLVAFVLKSLRRYGKSQRAFFVKFDPALPYGEKLLSTLTNQGARYTGRTAEMKETIQPRFNAVVYREDFSEAALSKKTQQFLRKARHSHSEILQGGSELIPAFSELMKKTEKRKDISLRDATYYEKLLQTYKDGAFITLIKLNLLALSEEAAAQVEHLQRQQAATSNAKRLKTLAADIEVAQKNLLQVAALHQTHGDTVAVAGTLTISVYGSATTLYAGTDTAFQKYYPSYLVWTECIEEAFARGAQTLDMGGLENSLSENDGLLSFKKHFNPRIEEYIGEFDLPVNRLLFPLARIAYHLRKTAF